MSIICGITCPEGIVLAADSRNTLLVGNLMKFNDHAQKVFSFTRAPTGIACCGNYIVEGRSIQEILWEFEGQYGHELEGKSLKEIVDMFAHHVDHYRDVTILFGGYMDGDPHAYVLKDGKVTQLTDAQKSPCCGLYMYGHTQSIDRLLYSKPKYTIAYELMSIKDAIDYADFLINLAIQTERFQLMRQSCGGEVDILVVFPHNTKWYRHKIYKSKKPLRKIKRLDTE